MTIKKALKPHISYTKGYWTVRWMDWYCHVWQYHETMPHLEWYEAWEDYEAWIR